ncbi:hypothetical protein CEXT_319421 [Caerostris extrusa]|uniref:Uncharacterized protein n=1 Tax=Caerostris extrusa TaxID=172846 RepID=A0AAV4UVD6_CAEEX|nr:hypothetical protein CEXT_319421 [Caerostris extrusa]
MKGSDHAIRTRRCLLRPISDPKIEEKLSTSEEFSNGIGRLNNTVQIPKPTQGGITIMENDKSQAKGEAHSY